MIRSRLFLKLFSTIVVVVGLFSAAIYLFSVPLVLEKAYDIELNASHTILDNVFELASRIKANLEESRAITVEAYKARLKDVVAVAASYIDYEFSRAERGEISEATARRQIYDGLRTFKYGNNDYIWLINYDSVLLSHPDPSFQGRNGAALKDEHGHPILPAIIAIARSKGEGFYTYPWRRLGDGREGAKISYFRDLPKWHMVVGTGAYLDDIDAEAARRKARAIADLREALRHIRIARTGYVYIFDAANHMIIHPNSNIEGTEFGRLRDPATGQSIARELKAAAERGQPLTYRWDKPDDPGNYAYEKISWVRHFPGFDWYIASSVYVDELRRSSDDLGRRILAVAGAVLLGGILLGYWAARRLVAPLNRLAATAAQIQAGDLTAESGIRRDDEIGILAAAFDGMIRRVRDNIATLDSRVAERTTALEEVEARQRLILDAIPASIAYLDRRLKVQFANARWAELVLRGKDEVIGATLAALIGRHAWDSVAATVERTRAGHEETFEYAFPRKGRTLVTKTTLIPHRGAGGETVGMFVLTLDVTDERETERQLMEVQRLKAVGQLSGGLAHDFNNLLSIVIGNLAVARDRFDTVDGLDEYLEPALRAGRRGADITSRLLAFSRQHPLRPEPVEVCGLVRETAVLLRGSLPPSIDIRVPGDTPPCWTIADQAQLENALVNLALNARDAMPDDGILAIEVGTRTVAGPLAFDEKVRPDEYLEIRVADNGAGFAPDALVRAFEPFFTTKRLGSGLGLSMVYGFVKQSRGYIDIASRPGAGTTVTILLPRAEPAPQPAAVAGPAAPAESGWQGRLALVAEDDGDVRRVMRQQLVDLGFSVMEAENGDEAARLIEQVEGLELLVSDIVMPQLSGTELARRVRASHPEIRIILVSGFSVEGCDLDGVAVLRKPWDRGELVAAIGRPAGQEETA